MNTRYLHFYRSLEGRKNAIPCPLTDVEDLPREVFPSCAAKLTPDIHSLTGVEDLPGKAPCEGFFDPPPHKVRRKKAVLGRAPMGGKDATKRTDITG